MLLTIEGETYTYHWSLLETPSGDDIGQTDGIDEPRLQLSKVSLRPFVIHL